MSIILGFLDRWLCNLGTNIVLFLPFQSVYLLSPFLVALAWISSMVMTRNGRRGCILTLYLILVGKLCSSPLKMMLDIRFLQIVFIKLWKFPTIPHLLWVFFFMKGCYILSNAFSISLSFFFLASWCEGLHQLNFKC